ncbi:MAG: iron-sulfur cluster assembly accessory protein [Ectothiorhodospiraceae bacterium]|nr:iron-sulfur cluster assembly accessory protein [Chromatiales bacterium]MCP5153485.1 iron-sulfur cluster assembly accessory protein [Ectothiorhodospiraceae bacterium]
MSVQSIVPFQNRIQSSEMTLTDAARTQLAGLFASARSDDEEIKAVRIFVAGGGCSGMTYGMTFTDRRHEHDKVYETDDLEIYIDAVAMQYVGGVEIDYVTRDTGATFVFNNVFQATGGTGTCGACGAAGGCGG